MIDDKKSRHRDKPNRMSDAEIMVILILLHTRGPLLLQVLLQRVCLQTSETPVSASSFL